MIYVLIVIAILLFFLVHAVRNLATQFVKWADADLRLRLRS